MQAFERALAQAEEQGRAGLALGTLHEARARIAIWTGDRESFEKHLALCQEDYDPDRFPAMRVVLAKLLDEARQHGMGASEATHAVVASIHPATAESEYETIHSRIAECVDLSDRGRCALTLLLQTTMSSNGYLFGMGDRGSVRLLAALPDQPSRELERWIERFARETIESEDDATGATGDVGEHTPTSFVDSDGRTFLPALLFDESTAGRRLAAALVLQVDSASRVLPAPDLRTRIARELIEHGDVQGWA